MILPTSFSTKFVSAGALLHWSLLAVAIFFGSQTRANASTITAQSVSFADVSAAVASATDGDTVMIPAGTATWTRTLVVTKSISLIGAGQSERGQTTITQGVDTVLELQMALHENMRLSGITFVGTVTTGKPNWILISGADTHTDPGYGIRIDHCSFEGGTPSAPVTGYTLYFKTSTTGVVDHCFWGPGVDGETVFVSHQTWSGKVLGDGSFYDAPPYGPDGGAVFLEDNVFESIDFAVNGQGGGRDVQRHNLFWGQRPGGHGIDSGGSLRGAYSSDVYNNIIRRNRVDGTQSTGPIVINCRGGSRRAFNNYGVGTYTSFTKLDHYRMGRPNVNSNTPWLGANGRNPWDLNDRANHTNNSTVTLDGSTYTVPGNGVTVTNTCNGSRPDGSDSTNVPCKPSDARYGYIYASGTYSGPAVTVPGTINLELVSPNANCWQFYTLINKSQNSNNDISTIANYAIIGAHGRDSSGVTALAIQNVADTALAAFSISNGQQWEIRHVSNSMDQIGAGKTLNHVGGTSGATDRYLVTVTDSSHGQVVNSPGYPAQETDGVYFWNNKMVTETQNKNNPSWRSAAGWSSAPTGQINLTEGDTNPYTASSTNPNAQIFLGREVFNRAPAPSDLGGDYNWNASTPAGTDHPETRVGPDDEAVAFAWNGSPPAGYIASFYIDGSGGYAYPHPLTLNGGGGDAPSPPQDVKILP